MPSFEQLPLPSMPVRLAVTAIYYPGTDRRTSIVVTLDPPSDRFEVVWYQDTMTEVLTTREMADCVSSMVYAALEHLDLHGVSTAELPDT